MTQNQPPEKEVPAMRDLYMQYPPGSKVQGEEVIGYRQTKNQSIVLLSNGKWQDI